MKRWPGYRNVEECIISGGEYVNTRTGPANVRLPIFVHPNYLERFRDFDFVLKSLNLFPLGAMGIPQLKRLLQNRNPNVGEEMEAIPSIPVPELPPMPRPDSSNYDFGSPPTVEQEQAPTGNTTDNGETEPAGKYKAQYNLLCSLKRSSTITKSQLDCPQSNSPCGIFRSNL
ncbi:hypothetical protein LIER_17326 [Lithospermum erythrorhizon]|uniref:Uncharacterized protein n=1 Tax=Lithospermum erythrorhizon TaxID=34254 RepID=A0AAV3QCK7_LITER